MSSKLFSIFCILICLAGKGIAQTKLALSGGLNISSLHNEEEFGSNEKSRLGFNGSVVLEQELKNKLGLRVGLGYAEGGQNSLKLQYISLPLSAYFNIFKILKVYAGPEFSYLIKREDNFDVFDYGVHAGLEVKLAPTISFGIKNNFGLKYNSEYSPYRYISGADNLIDSETYKANRNNTLSIYLNFYLK